MLDMAEPPSVSSIFQFLFTAKQQFNGMGDLMGLISFTMLCDDAKSVAYWQKGIAPIYDNDYVTEEFYNKENGAILRINNVYEEKRHSDGKIQDYIVNDFGKFIFAESSQYGINKSLDKTNRTYKASIFEDLYTRWEGYEARQLELYNALYGTEYKFGEVYIDDVSLIDSIYKNHRNDFAAKYFGLSLNSVLFTEEQSTINNNMPLRDFFYMGRVFEKFEEVSKKYRKKLIKIPTPRFVVFYLGEEDYPKETELRLSDAFEYMDEKPQVELIVKVINLNIDKEHHMLEKCPTLKEYATFVTLAREEKKKDKDGFMKRTIKKCIEQKILVDYLKNRGSEVENMFFGEYSYEDDIREQRAEAAEEGEERGVVIRLLELIMKKLTRGKTVSQIAEDVEESEDYVQQIVDLINDNKGKSNKELYELMTKMS